MEDRLSWSEHALASLRAKGHPLTPQREAVVRWLEGRGDHPSAAEVRAALEGAGPWVGAPSRSTVYKTLALLVSLGLARAVPAPSGELRFDPRTDPHDHFYCRRCRCLTDLSPAAVQVGVPAGFTVQARHVLVEGTCGPCAAP